MILVFFRSLFVVFALIFLPVSGVHAQTLVWDGGAGTKNWGDANNWNPNQIPNLGNDVIINPTASADVEVMINISNAVCKTLVLNGPGSQGENQQAAIIRFSSTGKLTVVGKMLMNGTGLRTSGISMINGGYLSCGGWEVTNNNPELWEPGTGTVEITASCSLPEVTKSNIKFGTFNNLIINAPSGTVTLGQNILLTGDLTIRPTSTFDVYNNKETKDFALEVKGNWINDGSFQGRAQTVSFTANTKQAISGSSTTTFHILVLNKLGADLWLEAPIAIRNQLTFSNGLINSSPVNRKLVTFNEGSSYVGASASAFISGPVAKTGATAFAFPIGKETAGQKFYAPLEIGAGATSSTFTTEYFPVTALTLGSGRHPDIKHISNCEYWTYNRNEGTATPDVSLTWSPASPCGGPSYITQAANLKMTAFNTKSTNPGTWDVYGGTATGDALSGKVTFPALGHFVPLTLASIASLNPLPIRFANLTATEQANGVQVAFSNMTEEDVAKYHIERSADGNQFIVVGSLAPRLNNNQRADYTYLDPAPLYGDNYYHIRGVETNGRTIYSDVVRLVVNAKGRGFHIYPNPARVNSTVQLQLGVLPAGKYQLHVYNQQGQVVRATSFVHTGGNVSTPVSTMGMAPGRYLVELGGAQKWVRTLVLH